MILAALGLVSLGLAVGLSGAVIPGPLLTFTVFDTSKKGRVTGHYVIAGHVLWELGLILLITLGFGWIFEKNSNIIYLVGGGVLALMGADMVRRRPDQATMERPKVGSSIGGGLFYTVFNPAHPLWWGTAGLALLLKGLEVLGLLGVILVTLGHWLSDFGYYTFVSFLVHHHRSYVSPRQRQVALILGLFLVVLGVIFFRQGLEETFFSR